LGTYIDVLQIQPLDRDMRREEIMRALNDVVESGKVRYKLVRVVLVNPGEQMPDFH